MPLDLESVRIMGNHLGYPKCCIESFYDTCGALGNPEGSIAGRLNGKGTGFIPCPECAKKINLGEIKLGDLIVNRKHPLPFPNVDRNLLP